MSAKIITPESALQMWKKILFIFFVFSFSIANEIFDLTAFVNFLFFFFSLTTTIGNSSVR